MQAYAAAGQGEWAADLPVVVRERARLAPQPRLAVGNPGDRFEREANRVADAFTGRTADAAGPAADQPPRLRESRGGGVPLAAASRALFEPKLGRDLGAVRVHADPSAHHLADAMGARAFTFGSDIYFNRGEYTPANERGRRLIAHELAHVVQQAQAPAPVVMRDCSTPDCGRMDWLRRETAPSAQQRLTFFHGTRWSVAKKIPGNVKAVGGGDFAAGFYTHHDASNAKAFLRTLQWACRTARDAKEKYGGVIKFDVDGAKYAALGQRKFPLTSLDQADYATRQAEWLDFVTSHGREKEPVFEQRKKNGVWVHNRRDPQPALADDVIQGPFYRPIPGEAGKKPPPTAFDPFAEGRDLPQQVVFANKGVDLLNDASTKTELSQHECDPLTGNRIDPPDASAAAAAGTPSGKEVPMIE